MVYTIINSNNEKPMRYPIKKLKSEFLNGYLSENNDTEGLISGTVDLDAFARYLEELKGESKEKV